jgi:hypothetical protein
MEDQDDLEQGDCVQILLSSQICHEDDERQGSSETSYITEHQAHRQIHY